MYENSFFMGTIIFILVAWIEVEKTESFSLRGFAYIEVKYVLWVKVYLNKTCFSSSWGRRGGGAQCVVWGGGHGYILWIFMLQSSNLNFGSVLYKECLDNIFYILENFTSQWPLFWPLKTYFLAPNMVSFWSYLKPNLS